METTLLKPKTKTPNSFKGGHGPYFALHHDERIQQALDRYFEANPSHTLDCRFIDSGSHYVIIAGASMLDSNGQQICQQWQQEMTLL